MPFLLPRAAKKAAEPPPPPPTRDDPAIAEARKKQRLAALRRRGRAGSKFFGRTPEDELGAAPVVRPEARAAQVLGD